MFNFFMPIGDWSNDGHGRCKYYLIESNKDLDQVKVIHEQIKRVTGIDIESICSEDEDNNIMDDEKNSLEDIGFDTSTLKLTSYSEDRYDMKASDMCRLWVFLLEKTDPSLEIKIRDVPSLTVFVGYGVM